MHTTFFKIRSTASEEIPVELQLCLLYAALLASPLCKSNTHTTCCVLNNPQFLSMFYYALTTKTIT